MQVLDFTNFIKELDKMESRNRSTEMKELSGRKKVFKDIVFQAESLDDCKDVDTQVLMNMLSDVEGFAGGKFEYVAIRDNALSKVLRANNRAECRVV